MLPKQTLLIERVMDQTRLAVIEEGSLCELYVERPGMENVTGNIYLGRVENVLKGMNAAFVDIGMDKNGFLSADNYNPLMGEDRALTGHLNHRRLDSLRPGKEILVQVTKAQPGVKGPRLSSGLTLPGRLMVLMPEVDYVGVSKKINGEAERQRLLNAVREVIGDAGCGVIVRTAAEGATSEALRDEFDRLHAAWLDIKRKGEHFIAPKLLYDNSDLLNKVVRDRLSERVEAIWVDDGESYSELRALADSVCPQWSGRIRLHEGDTPLFDLYRVDSQQEAALQKFVWLKGGGSLVIEETEALTAVDVNTARNVGRDNIEDTILKNNLEAGREIMRQLRLRDIGGIIVVDFIDMKSESHRQALLEELRQCAALDANRTTVVGMTALGLVEITRKKQRQSLSRQLTHTCARCDGNGFVPSHETVARQVVRQIWRRRRGGFAGSLLCEANEKVCGWIRTVGVPEGCAVYLKAVKQMEAGEYRLSPVDASTLPQDCKPLK